MSQRRFIGDYNEANVMAEHSRIQAEKPHVTNTFRCTDCDDYKSLRGSKIVPQKNSCHGKKICASCKADRLSQLGSSMAVAA